MRTENLAIVFTDIKGYTAATSSQTHSENAQMLGRIERLVEPLVRGFGGQVVKTIGDAYMVVFRSPTVAVQWATAVQDRLAQHNGGAPEGQAIHIRIAMNVGEVRVHRGDVFGEPVNIASRLEGITPADEVYLSASTFLTMNRTDLACELVGEYELKGIPEPVTVYRAKRAQEGPGGGGEGADKALPYGGKFLQAWQRSRWVRRINRGLWGLVAVGLLGAAYLRFRPASDYGHLVEAAKVASENGDAVAVLAAVGQIPEGAIEERLAVLRYRHAAVSKLIEKKDLIAARREVEALLGENRRDSEALALSGRIGVEQNKPEAGLKAIAEAVRLDPTLGKDPGVVAAVVQGYRDTAARRIAEQLVEGPIREAAVPTLLEAVRDDNVDRKARIVMAERLERLGAGSDVDWVALSLDDLKGGSCTVKKAAINRLLAEGDERAVGPLMKVADSKGCHAKAARAAANAILGK